jgi:nucleotide-binding universal stress UspA family protein
VSFQRILVAIDTSSQAQIVFEQAIELAKKDSASLMVFYGIDLAAKRTYATEIGLKTQEAQELLQVYQQKAKDQGVTIEISHRPGQPGESICNLAQSWKADLIVLGRRGYKGITEVLLGSVSNYVVHHAPCSVLIVQSGTSGS